MGRNAVLIPNEENLGRNVDGTSIHARLGTNSTW